MINRLFIALIFILSFSVGAASQESGNNGFLVNIGDKAPDFSTLLTDGTTFRLSEQRGKIVMLQFTASWCGVCRREMPYIEKDIWEKLKDKPFVLIGLDRDEPMETVKSFAEKMEISYPLALDPDADIFGLYADKLSGVTRNVIIDEQGKIIYLTRLFEMEEFNEMTAVIFDAVEKIQ
ncbi:MAG: TlpA family protein disulfide reductase [Bacteroidales bacterium]|nr:TlpA family protein disulfide reductase [Bacteroidales bacterium]